MITAPELEIAVLVLGMAILLVEAFATKIDKRVLAFVAIAGLSAGSRGELLRSPGSSPSQATGFWSFYTADRLSIFFKRFALRYHNLRADHDDRLRTGSAQFISRCYTTGRSWRIFRTAHFHMRWADVPGVSNRFRLHLCFAGAGDDFLYVLVSFTRRNPITLEAGTKYLVLSALSTAFLVYGIAWIFGVTGQTNLQRIADALANPATDRSAALFGMVLVLVALGFKIAAVPFQIWVPDVYQGAPTPVTAYLSVGSKAAGFVVLLRVLQPFLALPQTQRLIVVIALLTLIYGNLAGSAAGESETTACLLEYRARRLSADRRSVFRRVSHRLLPCRLPAHDAA